MVLAAAGAAGLAGGGGSVAYREDRCQRRCDGRGSSGVGSSRRTPISRPLSWTRSIAYPCSSSSLIATAGESIPLARSSPSASGFVPARRSRSSNRSCWASASVIRSDSRPILLGSSTSSWRSAADDQSVIDRGELGHPTTRVKRGGVHCVRGARHPGSIGVVAYASHMTAPGAASGRFRMLSSVSLRRLLEVAAEFDHFGGASLGLVAWELCVEEELVAPAWRRAVSDGLIAPAGRDYQEQLWRLSSAGWVAAALPEARRSPRS